MMNISNCTRLLLLAAVAALPRAAWATTDWAPLTTLPFLSTENPNFTAPYVWGADPFTLNNSGGPVAGDTLIGQPVQIAPFSTSLSNQPTPIWTGSTAFQYGVDTSNTSTGANDGMIGVDKTSTAGIMAWMPTTYPVDKALNEPPSYHIVAAQSAVNIASGDTIDIGMLGNPGGGAIRTQTGANPYVPGCTFEYDMGSVWISVTNEGAGNAQWAVEARETIPASHAVAPSSADVTLASGTLTGFNSTAWYLAQVWYDYSDNVLNAQLVNASGVNLLPAGAENIALGSYDPDIQGYGFEVDGGLIQSESGNYSFQPSSGGTHLDNFTAVPEPSSVVLAGLAAAGAIAVTLRKRRIAVVTCVR